MCQEVLVVINNIMANDAPKFDPRFYLLFWSLELPDLRPAKPDPYIGFGTELTAALSAAKQKVVTTTQEMRRTLAEARSRRGQETTSYGGPQRTADEKPIVTQEDVDAAEAVVKSLEVPSSSADMNRLQAQGFVLSFVCGCHASLWHAWTHFASRWSVHAAADGHKTDQNMVAACRQSCSWRQTSRKPTASARRIGRSFLWTMWPHFDYRLAARTSCSSCRCRPLDLQRTTRYRWFNHEKLVAIGMIFLACSFRKSVLTALDVCDATCTAWSYGVQCNMRSLVVRCAMQRCKPGLASLLSHLSVL